MKNNTACLVLAFLLQPLLLAQLKTAGNGWDMDHAAYAKLLSLNIDAADIGHGNAAGMMRKKKNGISVDSKLLELTKEYLS